MIFLNKIVKYIFDYSYAFIYIGIAILLWDTFGMLGKSNPYPFALIFLTFFAGLLLVKKPQKILFFEGLTLMKGLITIEIAMHIIANFHRPHSNFQFAKEIRYESFVLPFLLVVGLFWILHLYKKENRGLKFILVALSSLFLLFEVLVASNPGIDTYHYMEVATKEIIIHKNPYLIKFGDYYNGEFKDVYGGQYVFNYWPISLYLCTFSKLVFSDVRFIMVIFQLLIGFVLLTITYRKRYSQVWLYFLLLWIMNPVVAFVNIQSWVDAFAPLYLLLTIVFLQKKNLTLSAITLGLLASIKLYYCFTVPFVFIFIWNHQRPEFLRYVLITFFGFIVTFIPFLALSPNELFNNTVIYFTKSKLRLESLSYIAYIKWIVNIDLSRIGLLLSILFLFFGYAKAFLKKMKLFELIQVMNFSYLAFFLFSKQAFCNYYYYNLFLSFLLIYYSMRNEAESESKIVVN